MRIFLLVIYDIKSHSRRRRIANEIKNFGTRVQQSVYECYLSEPQVAELRKRLGQLIHRDEDDLRYFQLCAKDRHGIQEYGVNKNAQALEGYYLF